MKCKDSEGVFGSLFQGTIQISTWEMKNKNEILSVYLLEKDSNQVAWLQDETKELSLHLLRE